MRGVSRSRKSRRGRRNPQRDLLKNCPRTRSPAWRTFWKNCHPHANASPQHDGKAASDFVELRNYLTRDGHRLTGVYTFEFVREQGPRPGDALILREISPRSKDGKNVRVYGFADGRAVEMSFHDEEQYDGRDQIRWERAQLGLPPPVFQESR